MNFSTSYSTGVTYVAGINCRSLTQKTKDRVTLTSLNLGKAVHAPHVAPSLKKSAI
jgi:hypothetical protein